MLIKIKIQWRILDCTCFLQKCVYVNHCITVFMTVVTKNSTKIVESGSDYSDYTYVKQQQKLLQQINPHPQIK